MQLDSVELFHLNMRLKAPFETSFGVEQDRECLILKVQGEGLAGWGECVAGQFPGYSYETAATAWHMLKDFYIPALLAAPLMGIQDFRDRIAHLRGHPMARAGLEMALWDLWGKAQGKGVKELLGGDRRSVPVGVSVGLQDSTSALLLTVQGYVDSGYARVKLKIKPGRDLELVRAVRQTFPDLPLQVDANSAYTLADSGTFQSMDDLDLLMIEQPLAEDDLLDHVRLQAELKTALCLDESILSARIARQALEAGACRIINIKAGRVGGLAEAAAIHEVCRAAGAPVWCGGMLETGIGRASNLALASLPGFTLPGDISASERYYAEDIAEPLFMLNPDSTIQVPEGPGLGVRVVEAALQRVTLRHELMRAA
ncbi:MAG TPA: o-succinylbenzoate synthase [Anaerolineales bacterium]